MTEKKRKARVWSQDETVALIQAWEDRFELFKTNRRTVHLHEGIRQDLEAKGIHKTMKQIVVKIDNLTQKYRKTKFSTKIPTWFYFQSLNKFLCNEPRRRRGRKSQGTLTTSMEFNDAASMSVNVTALNENVSETSANVAADNNRTPIITNVIGAWSEESCLVDSSLNKNDVDDDDDDSSSDEDGDMQKELLSLLTSQLDIQSQCVKAQQKLIRLLNLRNKSSFQLSQEEE